MHRWLSLLKNHPEFGRVSEVDFLHTSDTMTFSLGGCYGGSG
jgi:hypothetical protein